MDEKYLSLAQKFVPRVISIIDQLVAADEFLGRESLGLLSELCEIECSDLVTLNHAKDMATLALKIATNPELEPETRVLALVQIKKLIKYKTKAFTKFNLVENLCLEMQKAILQEEIDDGIMSENESDKNTVYTSALQTLDEVANNLPAETTIKILASHISDLLNSDNAKHLRAGLLILSVISEGCAELILLDHMEELTGKILENLNHADSVVQSAAYFTLGQFSEYLKPDIADYADQIMPNFMKILSLNSDAEIFQNKEVISQVFYALGSYISALTTLTQDSSLDAYLEELTSTLVQSLEIPAGQKRSNLPNHLLISVMSVVESIAKTVQIKFAPFLEKTVKNLKPFFPDAKKIEIYHAELAAAETNHQKLTENQDPTKVWSKSIATLASIAEAVGGEFFTPYADMTFELAVSLSGFEPSIKASCFGLLAALAMCLENEIAPHMKTVTDILFNELVEKNLDFKDNFLNFSSFWN